MRGDDGIVTATVRADAFCHNMVRSLIGALLFVGTGIGPPTGRARCWPPVSGTPPCMSYGRTG